MILQILALAAGVAVAASPAKPATPSPEHALAAMLFKVRQARASAMREAVLGGAEELRDAMAAAPGQSKKRLAARLPGMAEEPLEICRTLAACREAPLSLHVAEDALADDAFLALARPWIKLQEARGKAVKVTVDPGQGVRLDLEDLPSCPVVTLAAAPAPTGGLDVSVEAGPDASKAYAAARASFFARK